MKFRKEKIHVWHLEMRARSDMADEKIDRSNDRKNDLNSALNYEVKKVTTALPELSRFLYIAVGAPWTWYMRIKWTYQQWLEHLGNSNLETWVAFDGATPIGYYELEKAGQSVQICYFGLIPEYIGKGVGKSLLQDAINRSWQLGGERVWLHTCTLDHPQALANYLGRGFKIFREEDFVDNIPADPIQPWTDAGKQVMPRPETDMISRQQ